MELGDSDETFWDKTNITFQEDGMRAILNSPSMTYMIGLDKTDDMTFRKYLSIERGKNKDITVLRHMEDDFLLCEQKPDFKSIQFLPVSREINSSDFTDLELYFNGPIANLEALEYENGG